MVLVFLEGLVCLVSPGYKKLQKTFLNAEISEWFGIRFLRKDLLPYILAKKKKKRYQDPSKMNTLYQSLQYCLIWAILAFLLIVKRNCICIPISVTMSHFKALSQIWVHIDRVINKVYWWGAKKLYLYKYTGAWDVKLYCSSLTCTISTYVQYNPINKHTYPSSLGCDNEHKSQRFICKNNSPSLCNYYHLCIYNACAKSFALKHKVH